MKVQYLVNNLTRKNQVASRVELANTCWTRLRGLIGRSADEFTLGMGLWIRPCQGIHTIGMSFPIDAIYMDTAGRILRIYRDLAPFRLAALSLQTRSVLELPVGSVAHCGAQLNDLLELAPNSRNWTRACSA
jgi:uncharacterized protein